MTQAKTFLDSSVHFDASTPRYRQIYTHIKNAIYAGVLHANDRLPSARALAKEWGAVLRDMFWVKTKTALNRGPLKGLP